MDGAVIFRFLDGEAPAWAASARSASLLSSSRRSSRNSCCSALGLSRAASNVSPLLMSALFLSVSEMCVNAVASMPWLRRDWKRKSDSRGVYVVGVLMPGLGPPRQCSRGPLRCARSCIGATVETGAGADVGCCPRRPGDANAGGIELPLGVGASRGSETRIDRRGRGQLSSSR